MISRWPHLISIVWKLLSLKLTSENVNKARKDLFDIIWQHSFTFPTICKSYTLESHCLYPLIFHQGWFPSVLTLVYLLTNQSPSCKANYLRSRHLGQNSSCYKSSFPLLIGSKCTTEHSTQHWDYYIPWDLLASLCTVQSAQPVRLASHTGSSNLWLFVQLELAPGSL